MNEQMRWTVDIRVESGPHQGRQYTSSTPEIRIGRNQGNDIALPDDHTVSGTHARLYLKENQWFAEDIGSRNGLYRGDADRLERVSGTIPLDANTTLVLGSARLRVTLTCAAQSAQVPEPDPSPPHFLHIALAEGQLLYRLSGQDPLSRQYTMASPPSLASRIGRDLDRLAQRANLDEADGLNELRALGTFLTTQMVPHRVSERLEACNGEALMLSHDSELIDVPWELTLAGEEVWCERFALGRQIVLGDLSQRVRSKSGQTGIRMLIIADPLGDLPETREEAELFLGSLEQFRSYLDVDFLGGPRATVTAVLRGLTQVDIVYFIGHGQYDPARPEASGWRLCDGVLGAGHIRNLTSPPKIVFSNACNSAEEVPQEKTRMGQAANTGMASGLILGGVEAVVAARWPIRADSSAFLASTFFHQVLRGVPLGEALRQARKHTRRVHGENDLAWASFVLYGNPIQRLAPVAPVAACK